MSALPGKLSRPSPAESILQSLASHPVLLVLPFGLNYLAFPGLTPFLPTGRLGWSADPRNFTGLYQGARNDSALLSCASGNIAPPDRTRCPRRPPRRPGTRGPRYSCDCRLLGAHADAND